MELFAKSPNEKSVIGIGSLDNSIQEFLLLYFPCIFPEVKYRSLWILIVLTLQANFAVSLLTCL